MSVRRYELGAGSRGAGAVKALMGKLEEGLVPALRDVSGLVSSYAVDTGGGAIAVVTIYDDDASAEKGEDLIQQWGSQNLRGLLQQPPLVIEGDVRVHTT